MLHDPDRGQALDPDPGKTILRQTGPNASCAVWGGVGAAGKNRRRAAPPTANRVGEHASTFSGLSEFGKPVVKTDIEARLFRVHVELFVKRREERG